MSPETGNLILRGGRIIDPASGLCSTGDVRIADGRITAVSEAPLPDDGSEVIDCQGCIVAPGLLDIHVHFRDPDTTGHHDETITTGCRAAVAGGFTTVCCMPNTTPALDDPVVIRAVQHRGARANLSRVFPVACGTIGRAGERPAPVQDLVDSGAVAISDDGDGIADSGMMRTVLGLVRAAEIVFMQHCQDPTMTRGAAMNAGPLATRLGLTGWPGAAEEGMLRRDLLINRDVGARYHAQHLSVAGSVDALREARAQGQPASGEASPHHLLLTEDACAQWNTVGKVNPPLRTAQDIDALKKGIAEGVVTVLATDHAPHPPTAKEVDFASAAFGMVGLECALPLYREALIDDGVLDWPEMLAMMTSTPAALVGLDRLGLGRIAVDGPADLTVIDPDLNWTIDPSTFQSTGRNTPFAGRAVRGRAIATIVAGRITHLSAGDRASDACQAIAAAI